MKPDYILFTDGSSITEKNKVMQYAASSFLVINNHMQTCAKDAHHIGSGDSARAELFAICGGLKYIASRIKKGQNKTVLVLSDSQYSINLIEKHLLRWYEGKRVTDKAIARFESDLTMFKTLAKLMSKPNIRVTFIHIKSHMGDGGAGYIKRKFKDSGFNISRTVAFEMIMNNREVDRMAREETAKLAKQCGIDTPTIRLLEQDDQEGGVWNDIG